MKVAIFAALVGLATAGSFKELVIVEENNGMELLEVSLLDELQGSTHYGNPGEGCLPDEVGVRIQGVAGAVCAPKCDASMGCPSDVPDGCEATPQCMLQDASTRNKYCALRCSSGTNCGPGASCQTIFGSIGLCTYN